MQTFGNGLTYGEIANNDVKNVSNYPAMELVELPTEGPLSFSGQLMIDNAFSELFGHSGNLAYWQVLKWAAVVNNNSIKSPA